MKGILVGREPQLARACSFIEDRDPDDQGGIFSIWAPAGTGKTRMVVELEKRLSHRSFLKLQCDPASGSSAFMDFMREWFAPTLSSRDGYGEFSRQWKSILMNLELFGRSGDPGLMDFLYDSGDILARILGIPLRDGNMPPDIQPAELAELARRATAAFFQALVLTYPCVIVMEDVQWLSPDLHSMTEELLGMASRHGVVVLVTGRPEENEPPFFPDPPAPMDSSVLMLQGLPREGARKLTEVLLNASVSRELMDLIWERAGGNPLFIQQAVLYLKRSGVLLTGKDRVELNVSAHEIPAEVRDMFLAGMLTVSSSVRRVIETAAVLGNQFPGKLLESILSDGPAEEVPCEQALRRLLRDGVLIEEKDMIRFGHMQLRDWAASAADPRELRAIHLKAASLLGEACSEGSTPEELETAAAHYLAGGDRKKALRFLRPAAEGYAEIFQNSAAEKVYRLMIPMLKEPERTQAEMDLSDVYKNQGYLTRAIGLLRGTLERQETLDPAAASVMVKLGSFMGSSGDLRRAAQLLKESLTVFEREGDLKNRAKAVRELGVVMRSSGDAEQALELMEESIRLARETEDPSLICQALYWSAITCREMGDLEGMARYTEEQVITARDSGLQRSIIAGLDNQMRLHIYRREYAEAEDVFKKLAEAAGETGNWALLSTATSKMGIVHLRRGRYDEAEESFRKCIQFTGRTGNLRARCAALGNLAHVYILKGDTDGALRYSTELIDSATSIGYRAGLMSGYARMGYIFTMREDFTSALECIQTQIEHARALQDSRNLSDGWATMADIQFHLNDVPGALKSIERAMEFSSSAGDMRLYSSQLFLKGRVLFYQEQGQAAAEVLKRAHDEMRQEQSRKLFLCRLYLAVLGHVPELNTPDHILNLAENAPDEVAEAEVHFCHWRNTGDETSARRVRELIRETPSTRYLFNGLEGSSQDAHVTYGSPG